MALSTAKLTELPLPPRFFSTLPFSCRKTNSFSHFLFKPFSSSFRSTPSTKFTKTPSEKPHNSHSSSWLNKWTSPPPPAPPPPPLKQVSKKPDLNSDTTHVGTTAIERIVLRLRNLGLGSDDEQEDDGDINSSLNLGFDDSERLLIGDEKLGDLLKRDWVRPDTMLLENEDDEDDALLPWERGVNEEEEVEEEKGGVKRRAMKAPTLAELTIEDEELRRLRRIGMTLRERVNVPKAGITGEVLEKIHDKWRKCELVRLKFHEVLAHDMKTGSRNS
ncbi:CRS1/YhbY (CRM) domain-containing protein [Abeliophyllum distichum]|uniref:CRS1/YhbY (CRM) domain-containing protein n=1 Tax=Abeliophyllum distichum TaxID=126358 RepID=A0ABD1TW30_9LAMI